jgi:peptidoglycan/LPS O-acetylase OafA/YrhL
MPGAKKLDCLDGLRGIAVILVVLFHHRLMAESEAQHSIIYAALAPFRFGYSGVHLFLVLSGFCLTHSLLRRMGAGRQPSLRTYLTDRWKRIAPPYYAAVLIYLASSAIAPATMHKATPISQVSVRQLLVHSSFVHGFWADTIEAINSPFWSLSLEFQFYLLLPLLFTLAEKYGYRRMIVGVAALSVAWRTLVGVVCPQELHMINGVFLGRWSEFALGMGIAAWYNGPERRPLKRQTTPRCLTISLAFLGGAVVLSALGRHTSVDFLFGIGYASLLISVLLSVDQSGHLGRLIKARPFVRLGVISYSVYLTHSLVLDWTTWGYRRFVPETDVLTDLASLPAMLMLVLAAGYVFHCAIERHFLRSVDAVVHRAPKPHIPAGTLGVSPSLREFRMPRAVEIL